MWNVHFNVLLLAVGFIDIGEGRAMVALTKLYYFHGPSFSDRQIYNYNEMIDITQHESFNENGTTVLYIHGYIESVDSESIRLIVDAFNTRDDYNLIVLEWSDEASGDYFSNAVPNAISLGNTYGVLLLNAFKNGLDIEKFLLVGHSLGGQMAGYIGRKIISKSNNAMKLPRIVGLDPANPGFFPGIFYEHLSYKDARFVDIIHTDAGIYGQPIATGTADFWPNDGHTLQPGCPFRLALPMSDIDLCSHHRSFNFFAESVSSTNTNAFISVSARNWSQFKAHDTNRTNLAKMGLDCRTSAFGEYYLQTNDEKPFSRGFNGLRYLH